MAVADDLRVIARQERTLVFQKFDEVAAWRLGSALQDWGVAHKAPIAIEVRTFGRLLFFAALEGSAPENADWIRRKANVVDFYRRSSYAVGLDLIAKNLTFTQRSSQPERDYAPFGGSFPIVAAGAGVIGAVTVSGLDQRVDHMVVVEALCDLLGEDLAPLALEMPAN